MAYIQPEINKVTKKYKGKKDQESMLAQQRETQAIQKKYGVSMTGSCLTAFIQMPIFLALFNVIQNVPAYVGKVKDLFLPIANAIHGNTAAVKALEDIKNNADYASYFVRIKSDTASVNGIIDVIAKFPSDLWDKFSATVNDPNIVNAISDNRDKISNINQFCGIDLSIKPGWAFTIAFLIPVFTFVFQFLSMKVTPTQNTADPNMQQSMGIMKSMTVIFPIISFVTTVSLPAGLGLYWAAGALMSFLSTVGINAYYKHADMEKIIEKCKEKAAVKNAKKEASGKKSFMDKLQEAAYGQSSDSSAVNSNVATKSLKNYSSSATNNSANAQYRPGSLASKANAMQRYKDNNNGGNK